MAKVIPLGMVTRLDMPPDQVLRDAMGKFEGIVLVGFNHKGNVIAATSYADGGAVMWLLEACKMKLMTDEEE